MSPIAAPARETVTVRPTPVQRYLQSWRQLPAHLGYLLVAMPVAVAGGVVLFTLFSVGVALLIVYVGIFILFASLVAARWCGDLERVRLRAARQAEITKPNWATKDPNPSFWKRLFAPYRNPHSWTYLLHGGVISPVLSTFTWLLTVVWLYTAVIGVLPFTWYNVGAALAVNTDEDQDSFWLVWQLDTHAFGSSATATVATILIAILMLALLPLLAKGLVALHHLIARPLLGAWTSDSLAAEVTDLTASRSAAVAAEDQALRRLERDIHDGPQQRLVRLQMDLSTAQRRMDSDPEAVAEILTEARDQAREALEELRSLSRGFAPPIVEDRGLVAGLESLAARSTLPVALVQQLPSGQRYPGQIERNGYFIAAELLTNAAKHSGARRLTLSASQQVDSSGAVLTLSVADDGRGGAVAIPGHGLAGLQDRVRGLGGELVITSPDGGPTQVTARIPLPPTVKV